MLINVVILFIKDLLPIFILLCLIGTNTPKNTISMKSVLAIVLISCVGVFISFNTLPLVSELFDGLGVEIIQSIELLLVYICLLFGSGYIVNQHKLTLWQSNLMIIGTALFVVINSTQFILFLDSYMTNGDAIKNTTIGLVIGLGICLSFSALLYFLMCWFIDKAYYFLTYFIWAVFITGNLSQLINLLQQVDIIEGSGAIWDSSQFVKDSSEYGHLLTTLFGYEASPSFEFIMLYVISLLVFLIYFLKQSSSKRQCEIDSAKENEDVL